MRRDFAFAFLLALAELISGDPIADSAIVILRTARHVALVAAAGGLLAACKFGPVIVGYRTITVDPAAQRVDWQNPIQAEVDSGGLTRPTLGSYYQIFTGQSGTSVEHFFQRDPATPRVKYSYLDTNMKDHLVYRSVNTREILRGPFGTVYSEKTCFFHLPIESWSNELNVHLYANSVGEPPIMSDEPPGTAPATLTNVSVIRVLRGGPEFIVAAAMYGADGRAMTLSVEVGRNADWVQASVARGTGTRFFNHAALTGDEAAVMTSFGLPETISIEHALIQRPIGLATPSEGPVDQDAISLHYAYDRWLRQDEYLAGGEHHTRYLTYVRTPEDIALDEPCAERFPEREASLSRPFAR